MLGPGETQRKPRDTSGSQAKLRMFKERDFHSILAPTGYLVAYKVAHCLQVNGRD